MDACVTRHKEIGEAVRAAMVNHIEQTTTSAYDLKKENNPSLELELDYFHRVATAKGYAAVKIPSETPEEMLQHIKRECMSIRNALAGIDDVLHNWDIAEAWSCNLAMLDKVSYLYGIITALLENNTGFPGNTGLVTAQGGERG